MSEMTVVRVRVVRAWCVELNEEVTISQARREYLSLENPPPGFTFFCNDLACRNIPGKVEVSGVNYRVPAEEKEKYRTAHFRARQQHDAACAWVISNEPVEKSVDINDDRAQRAARRKLRDLVTVFDPRRSGSPDEGANQCARAASGRPASVAGAPSGSSGRGREGGETRTTDLDRLVDSFLEAKAKLPPSDFRSLHLQIVGKGRVLLGDYFQQVARMVEFGVSFGGIKQIVPYGYGFSLTFYDKIEGAPIRLYVPAKRLQDFRYRRFLKASVTQVIESKGALYLRVYCIGRFERAPENKGWNLIVDDLNHLVLRVMQKGRRDAVAGS